jgi:anti-sigma B factor antagonist
MDGGLRHVSQLRQLAVAASGSTGPGTEGLLELQASQPTATVRLLQVTGEIDLLTVSRLNAEVAGQLAGRPLVLVVDTCGVTFMGSAGIAALLTARDGALDIGASLRLVCSGSRVLHPIDLMGLTELFEVYPDVVSALRGRVGGSERRR